MFAIGYNYSNVADFKHCFAHSPGYVFHCLQVFITIYQQELHTKKIN